MSLAILSFFSAVFLPGAIIYKISLNKLNVKFSISHLIICSFIFSLCFNFILIYILSLGGIYTKNVVVGVFVIEIVLFLFLYFRHPLQNLEIPKIDDRFESLLFVFSILIALFILNRYVFKVDIFYGWDAVVSWNRWATEWANGDFILNDGGYPQLFPILLSLGYVASGKISSFQGIGSAIWGYFMFVGIVACLFGAQSEGIKDRIAGQVMALITYAIFYRFHVGYADLPVAMCILISAIFLLEAFKGDKNISFYLIFGAFAAGISTEIKQAGLFWIAIYIFGLIYLAFLKKIRIKDFIICVFIMLAFCAPWVIIALYKKLALNKSATNMSYTMEGIYYGKSRFERLLAAFKHYKGVSAVFFISLLMLRDRIFGFFALFGFIYFIFWGMHLSYDYRNLQGGIPLLIIALSALCIKYYLIFYKILRFIYRHLALAFVCVVALGCVIAPFYEQKVLDGEFKRKMTLAGKDTTRIVLDAFESRGAKTLLTSNQLIAYVPTFERKYYKLYHFGPGIKEGQFERYALELKEREGSFYILLPKKEYARYREFLSSAIHLGEADIYVLLEF